MKKPIQSMKFSNMSFWYSKEKPIFDRVEFEFPMNEVVLLEGASGSGKSALLKIMAGLAPGVEGEYTVNGSDLHQMSFEELIPWRMRVGYCFDLGGILHNRTLRENLKLPMRYHNVASEEDIDARVDHLLDVFSIREVELLRPSAVSGGRRKATVLARALILNPEVLLLDEPTIGLDQKQKTALIDWIKTQRKQGHLKHVFMCSNDKDFIKSVVTEEIEIRNLKLFGGSNSKQRNAV